MASKYKLAEVISIVSHQLKTPLSAIKGYLEVLISEDLGKLSEEQREYLRAAMSNTEIMIGLVKDLLDVSQIEEGKMNLKIISSDLKKIVEETIEEFLPLIRAKNCTLDFETEEEIPSLKIDPVKIRQVVTNLILNAIEYNKRKGEVKATLRKTKKEVIFCCQDTGIGIPESEKEKVFSKFYRNEKAVVLATGGSGLGLFISKAIIEKSKGKIWFKSKEGGGSTFCFSLPIK